MRSSAELPRRDSDPAEPETIRIAVMGRPNVGKSSLVNRLLGEERMIVDDVPGTTRDAVDTLFRYHDRPMILVDTAGLRRKLSSQPDFEFYATLRAIRSLETANVALLVLDATEPVSRQDLRIARMIDDAGCACVWVFNKWDLVEKDDKTAAHVLAAVRGEITFQAHAPAEFVSALTVQRVSRIPQRIVEVYEAARRKVPTGDLNACIRKAVEHNPPRALHGDRPIRIYYATQVKVAPPTFALFVSRPERLAARLCPLPRPRAPQPVQFRRQPDPTAGEEEHVSPAVARMGESPALPASFWGPFPSGLLWGRALRGIDVREHGSGNLGATNVYRVLGPFHGVAVLVLDVIKGGAAVLLARRLAGTESAAVAAGLSAVLGHMFSPWVRFRGGKGVATGLGIWLFLAPAASLAALAVWGVLLAVTRRVSAASSVPPPPFSSLPSFSRPGRARDPAGRTGGRCRPPRLDPPRANIRRLPARAGTAALGEAR